MLRRGWCLLHNMMAQEIGRRKMGAGMPIKGESEIDIVALKERVSFKWLAI